MEGATMRKRVSARLTEYAFRGLSVTRTLASVTLSSELHPQLESNPAAAANAVLPRSIAGLFSLAGVRVDGDFVAKLMSAKRPMAGAHELQQ